MYRIYSENDVTWSSIEKYVPYSTVVWIERKNGIPTYNFLDSNGKKIDIGKYVDEMVK